MEDTRKTNEEQQIKQNNNIYPKMPSINVSAIQPNLNSTHINNTNMQSSNSNINTAQKLNSNTNNTSSVSQNTNLINSNPQNTLNSNTVQPVVYATNQVQTQTVKPLNSVSSSNQVAPQAINTNNAHQIKSNTNVTGVQQPPKTEITNVPNINSNVYKSSNAVVPPVNNSINNNVNINTSVPQNNTNSEIKKDKIKLSIINKDYIFKAVIFLILFIVLFGSSFLLIKRFLNKDELQKINYIENGSLDYKIYLKKNDFYDSEYLNKGMYYVASLIKNINVDFDYKFLIDNKIDTNFTYSIIGKLKITDEAQKNIFYEKEYVLLDKKEGKLGDDNQYSIKQSLNIDYDYYNSIANNFRSLYGLSTSSSLTLYLRVDKNAHEGEKLLLNNTSEMSVNIPLSQKAIEIKIDDNGIEKTNSIIKDKKNPMSSILIVLAIILFIGSVAALLKLLEQLSLLLPEKTKYDKYVGKILREYDRLIVETSSMPKLDNKNIILIKKIEELLDARDNLKMPIIYYKVNDNKCYFLVEKDSTVYLMEINSIDLEKE